MPPLAPGPQTDLKVTRARLFVGNNSGSPGEQEVLGPQRCLGLAGPSRRLLREWVLTGLRAPPGGSVPLPGHAWLLALAHFGKRPWEWHLCHLHVPAEAELIPGCGMGAGAVPEHRRSHKSNSPGGRRRCCRGGWGFMDLGRLQGGPQAEPGFSASFRSSSSSRSSQILPWCPELSLPENLRWHRGIPSSRGSSRGMEVSRRRQAGGTRCLSPQPPAPQSNKTTEGPRGDPGIRSRRGPGPGRARGRCRGSLLTMPTALKLGSGSL